jgi:hypothetical protein
MPRLRFLAIASVVSGLVWPAAALAQIDTDQGWQVSVTPYLWLPGAKGDLGAAAGLPPTPVNAHFSDLFNKLSGFGMIKGDVRYGSFGALADYTTISIAGDHDLSTPGGRLNASGEVKASADGATLAGFYRFYASERFNGDVLIGARYTEAKISAEVALNNLSASGSNKINTWDPIIGVKGAMRTGEHGSLTGYADLDPFESRLPVWQVSGAYNYRFTDLLVGSVGLRAYGVDLQENGFEYRLTLFGPLVGLTFVF